MADSSPITSDYISPCSSSADSNVEQHQEPQPTVPNLPPEIILEILNYVPSQTLWLSARLASKQMQLCVHDIFTSTVIPATYLQHNLSLGSGNNHRWYDIRVDPRYQFSHFDPEDLERVFFKFVSVKPEQWKDKATEKLRRMESGTKAAPELWRVEVEGIPYLSPLKGWRTGGGEEQGGLIVSMPWKCMFPKSLWETRF